MSGRIIRCINALRYMNMTLHQIGSKVKATIEGQKKPVIFDDMVVAIMHAKSHGFTITNANELPLFFQSLIKNHEN